MDQLILLHTKPGIIPIVCGGLGNHIFIIVAGWIASRHTNSPLYILNVNTNDMHHNLFKNNYNKTIFKMFGIHIPIYNNTYELNWLYSNFKYKQSPETLHVGFLPWHPERYTPGTYMQSYYQYYPPIQNFESEIRSLLCEGIEEFREKIHPTQLSWDQIAFLHIRRGDYLNHSTITYVQPIEYYIQGINLLLQKNTKIQKIVIFSDDIEWVKQQPLFQTSLFEISSFKNELDDLAYMSLCRGGAIIANSTFSWWGAFLGPYESRAPIFYPKRWMKTDQTIDLFPAEWIGLDT